MTGATEAQLITALIFPSKASWNQNTSQPKAKLWLTVFWGQRDVRKSNCRSRRERLLRVAKLGGRNAEGFAEAAGKMAGFYESASDGHFAHP